MFEPSALYMRMKQAIQWLKQNNQMLQKDIAAKMGISEVAFSNGMKRIQKKYDDDFVISFHQATDEVFSLEWLLNGILPKFTDQKPNHFVSDQPIDNSSAVNAALASRDETIASIYARLDDKDKQIARIYEDKNEMIKAKDETIYELRHRLSEKDETIADLRKQIGMLEKQLATNNDTFAMFNQQIADLKTMLSHHESEGISDYPFPIGTADSQSPGKKRTKNKTL